MNVCLDTAPPLIELFEYTQPQNEQNQRKHVSRLNNEVYMGVEKNDVVLKQKTAPDGGFGWVLVFVTILLYIVRNSPYGAFAILYSQFVNVYDTNSSTVGWIISVQGLIALLSGVPLRLVLERFGCRVLAIAGGVVMAIGFFLSSLANYISILYVTYGLFTGVGAGCISLSAAVIIHQYFDKKQSIANAVSLTGIGLSFFIFGPLTRLLLDTYGLKGTMIIIGAISLHAVPLGMLYRPLPKKYTQHHQTNKSENTDSDQQNEKKKKCSLCRNLIDISLLRDLYFILFVFGTFLGNIGMSAFTSHLPSKSEHVGMAKVLVAFLPSIQGLCNSVGRVVFGFVGNFMGKNRILQYCIGNMAAGSAVIIAAICDSFVTAAIVTGAYGSANASALSIQTTVLVDMLGLEKLPGTISILWIGIGFGILFGPPTAGLLFDITGDYRIPFFVCGGCYFLGGLVIIPSAIHMYKQNKQSIQNQQHQNNEKTKECEQTLNVDDVTVKRPRAFTIDSVSSTNL